MDQGQSSPYTIESDVDDVHQLVNEAFPNDSSNVSPQTVTPVESHTEETSNLDILVNTSNMDTNITTIETPLTSSSYVDE